VGARNGVCAGQGARERLHAVLRSRALPLVCGDSHGDRTAALRERAVLRDVGDHVRGHTAEGHRQARRAHARLLTSSRGVAELERTKAAPCLARSGLFSGRCRILREPRGFRNRAAARPCLTRSETPPIRAAVRGVLACFACKQPKVQMAEYGFNKQIMGLFARHWRPFVLIVVPAVVIVWLVLPSTLSAVIFAVAFLTVMAFTIGGFLRNLWRGMTGHE
jgi:hypothetical protein